MQYLTEGIYQEFLLSFQHLPYGAVIGRTFCVHGGISPNLVNLKNISDLAKPGESMGNRLVEDLLWSDPLATAEDFEHSTRGHGYMFNGDVLDEFLDANSLTLMIRSHELHRDGFEKQLKRCLTIFSATDYIGTGNNGAVALLTEGGDYEIHTFRPIVKGGRVRARMTLPDWLFREIGIDPKDAANSEDLAEKLAHFAAADDISID
jgi:diadenosine tetraphosphatase ApaH/serine/threonine PP2A family protein phosphatase